MIQHTGVKYKITCALVPVNQRPPVNLSAEESLESAFSYELRPFLCCMRGRRMLLRRPCRTTRPAELCQLSVDGKACCPLPWNEAGPRIISSGLAFPNEGPAQRREEAALGVDSRRNQTRGL